MKFLLIIKDVLKRYISEILMTFVATMIPFATYIAVLTVITSKDVESLQLFRYAIDTNKLFGTAFVWFMIMLMMMLIKPGLRMVYYPLFIGFLLFGTELTSPYHVFSVLISFVIISSVFYQMFEVVYEKIKDRIDIEEDEKEDVTEEKEYTLIDIGDTFKVSIDNYDVIVNIEKEV